METFWILSDHKPWPYEVPQNICRLHFSIEIFLDRFSTFFTFGMVCPFLFLTGNHPILFAGKVSIQFCLLRRYQSGNVFCEGTFPVLFAGKVPIQFCLLVPIQFCFLERYPSTSVCFEVTHPVMFAGKIPTKFCLLWRYTLSYVHWEGTCLLLRYLSSSVFCESTHLVMFSFCLLGRYPSSYGC